MHVEEPGHDHECDVCLLVKHFPSSDLPKSDLQLPAVAPYMPEEEQDQQYLSTPVSKGFNATAPPLCRSFFIF
ncbi:hypothetical protein [Sulfurovum mangrovi]|uniref:hypothetical protein n=1 Tax=Sulfurovum mangrovi TaxID=2893889 RepID=UPI001E5AB29A|nr:hypothetical protein [Sulfurovum mangrovi]UFH58665.1 hypothetical protein LN246_09925 [Sulfurovum mangrovi]